MAVQKFYICETCKNLVGFINNHNAPLSCCGSRMKELVPNTVDAAQEKHLPDVSISGDTVTVKVGSVLHPMLDEHYIGFIYLQTENGGQRKKLEIGKDAVATFILADDKAVAVYAYCNLHGLWKVEV